MSVTREGFGPRAPVEAEPAWPLIQRAQLGDRAAFEELRALLHRSVRNVIRAVLLSKPGEWDDVEQEVWLSLWLGLGNYSPEKGPFAPYLRQAARFKATDYLRKSYRDRTVPIDESEGATSAEDVAPTPASEPAAGPVPAWEYRTLAVVVFEGESKPHQVLAWGFAQLLFYSVDTIVTELAHVPLRSLSERLEREYLAEAKDARVALAFARFRKRLHDEDTLGAHLDDKPGQNVAHWRLSVRRAAEHTVMGSEKEFVTAVFRDLPPDGSFPHESLTFGFVRLLRHNGAMLWDRDSATCLGLLADRFKAGYLAIGGLSETELQQSTAELSGVLGRKMSVLFTCRRTRLRPACLYRAAGETMLEDYAGDNPHDSVVAWLDAVQARLNREGCIGAAWLLYGHLRGYMKTALRVHPGGMHAVQ